MDPNDQLVTIRCPFCNHRVVCDRPELEQRFRRVGLLKRDSSPDWKYLVELLTTAAAQMHCDECLKPNLIVTPLESAGDEADDENWGQTRKCAGCQQRIPAERLEVFPNVEFCASCQSKDERGELVGTEFEYCTHCGDILSVTKSSGSGIARYVVRCPSCGKR